jgi:Ca2+-binding EF-hand superfamily protein
MELHKMFEENGVFILQDELHEIFNIVDDDKSGAISLEEFRKFISCEEA